MNFTANEQLVTLFRAYLETAHSGGVPAQPDDGQRQTDLFSLFTELAALQNEVKLESRQVKTAFDQFKDVFTTLQSGHDQLNGEVERSRRLREDLQRSALRPLLLELLELYDRLEAGLKTFERHRPSRLAWLCRREARLIAALKQGQEISLRRLEQLLRSYQITPVETVGKILDPNTMRASDIEQRADIDNGIVTEELRKGYRYDGELLRAAEVRVNRWPG
jgi:molecular chaperone GrpE